VERVQAAGLARVVVAMSDPNPQVGGNSLERLRTGGIRVETGLLAAEAEALNRGFVSRMRRGRPWVVSKIAASLDGRTALASGESKWITGPRSREDVQRLRAESAAVMTGVATVIADDPSLNVRLPEAIRQPLRVILDSRLTTPLTAKTLGLPGEALILTCHPERARGFRERGIRVEAVPEHYGRLDLGAALARLAEFEVNEILVEAGPTLNGALVRAGLIDELVIYVAPLLLGDAARGMFELPGLERMADRVECELIEIEHVGEDVRIRALCGRR
jgi:diaminohydroxyphosphoribosylaminopyrimidine deaminase/5-amino-6-(5-phosphoribosylamino)uracil reductase